MKTITRDFSQTYKNAITEALPQTKQIVDRFHILKNLTDDINNYIKRIISERVKIFTNIDIDGKTANEKEILNKRQRDKRESAMRKWKTIQEVQRLYKEKKSVSEIAKLMKITRQTIYVYLKQQQPLERTTNSILDPYIPMIKELIIKSKM